VTNGREAARLGISGRFDLIVLDVMLPGLDGFEVCRAVRRAGVDTPILLLTARAHEAEKLLGFETGADDYVTKPYSPRELRARVKALLRRNRGRSETAPSIYRFGDVEFDLARAQLRRGGQAIELTALEFKLLSSFVRHPGRVLTRQQLLDDVWGVGTHVTDRVVDNQVISLRRKIEADPAYPRLIVSLRGLGYRFDGDAMTER
jgi:DNA-binding response OmpR family regulator